jgi:hypothetical protein
VKSTDDTDLDLTIALAARSVAPAPAPSRPLASGSADDDLDATAAPVVRSAARPPSGDDDLDPRVQAEPDERDTDPTVAPASHWSAMSASPAPQGNDDADATRVPRGSATAIAEDRDATVATAGISLDETRVPTATPHVSAPARGLSTEARVVANMRMVVTEASPSCQTVIGARPDTIVGGQLSDLIARTLRFVATGDGPSSLSLSIARATAGNTITVTFQAGQKNHS